MNNKEQKNKRIFGPVPSRRLGRSLGIDLIPYKTCTYDCIYCQVGHTTDKTAARKTWVSVDEIIAELKEKLSSRPDCITLSGSGEPTLFAGCGELIKKIKQITDIPVAVITNGSMLSDKQVRSELLDADIVVPSLDAGDEEIFQKINKPAAGITFAQMLKGLIDFRSEFKKDKYWLEVFFIADLNDDDEQVEKMAACIAKIRPDKIQLNTVTRPPADDVKPVKKERLAEIAKKFGKNAEVIADFKTNQTDGGTNAKDTDIIEMQRQWRELL